MNKFSFSVFFTSTILWICLLFFTIKSFALEIIVCPTCNCTSIQSGINLAKTGDAVLVKKGTYNEHTITINKSITLSAEVNTVVDLQKKGEGFIITADHVTLKGFIIKNSMVSNMNDYAGILVSNASFVEVTNNFLQNTFFGIRYAASKNGLIANNKIIGENIIQSQTGNGIQLWQCSNISIKNNLIKKHRDGIYFEFANYCHINNNTSEENFRYGLHFMNSNHDSYSRNTFRNNGTGAAVMYSHYISMLYNTFENNWGDASYALLLKDISTGIVRGNRFIKNTSGILLDGSNYLKISSNLFQNNGWAMKIYANCVNDTFANNNFILNTFDVSTNGTMYTSIFKNNYWDKYEGYDLNKDKVGDVPYLPVSLYSIIIEQMPQALMLLRSFAVNILDKTEKMIPSLIPDQLKDESPAMQKNNI